MQNTVNFIQFSINDHDYALRTDHVLRVIQSVQISEAPIKEKGILGIINYHGTLIPVMDICNWLKFESTEVRPENFIVIAMVDGKHIAFVVNRIGFIEVDENNISNEIPMIESAEYIEKIITNGADITYLLDIKKLVTQHVEEYANKSQVYKATFKGRR